MSDASWTCPHCGTTITGKTNAELGWKVSAHLSTHQNRN